jgi:hypothetical protein
MHVAENGTLLTGRDKGRVERLLEAARRSRRPGRPRWTVAQAIRDDNRWFLYVVAGLRFREIAWLEQQDGQRSAVSSTGIEKVLSRRPAPISIAQRAESSVRDSVNRVQRNRAPAAPPPRARRRRLDALAAETPVYQCPDHGRDCDERCKHMLMWRSQIETSLPRDRSGA